MLRFLLGKLLSAADRRLPGHLRDARRGEQMAYEHLRRSGYKIVARNYRQRRGRGEIDLIGWDGDSLAFVEVKTRRNCDFGAPEKAVDADKRRHLMRAAYEYSRRAGVDPARARFDIVSVTLDPDPELVLYKRAFSARAESRRQAGLRAVRGSRRSGPSAPGA